MADLEVFLFPCLSDNYGVLLHDPQSGATASIDAPDAAAVERAAAETGWKLSHILVTHHHADHTGGNRALKAAHGLTIVGAARDAERIPAIDVTVDQTTGYDFAGHHADVIDTPGHTVGHIAYHFAADRLLFCGDTLFSLGCGRVFEGTMEQMWSSLDKLRALPGDTAIYCGHEYTQANARFALTVDPDNPVLVERAREVDALRAAGKPTVPTTMAAERAANPFVRPDDPAIRAHLGMTDAADHEVFAEIRRRKDSF